MRIVVFVNGKWLVSVEADSVKEAERRIADMDGISKVCAFDDVGLKTAAFAKAVATSEFVSLKGLESMIADYEMRWTDACRTYADEKAAREAVEELTRKLDEAKHVWENAVAAHASAHENARAASALLGTDD